MPMSLIPARVMSYGILFCFQISTYTLDVKYSNSTKKYSDLHTVIIPLGD